MNLANEKHFGLLGTGYGGTRKEYQKVKGPSSSLQTPTLDTFGRCSVRLLITKPTSFIMIFVVFCSPSRESPLSYLQFLMHYQKIICILSDWCRRYISYKWIDKEKVKIWDASIPVVSGPEYSMNFKISGSFTFFSPVHSEGLELRYSDNIRLLL
jgi:hypothetical protein